MKDLGKGLDHTDDIAPICHFTWTCSSATPAGRTHLHLHKPTFQLPGVRKSSIPISAPRIAGVPL